MKCYYEELGIPRDAKDTDIKTAYRKLALRWHPDKNPDAVDEAKERFQLIQQAYEVLSDPQERAWYDNHREQILRGKNSDYTENCLDVFEYFTSSCFRGYGDDEKGFYAVYREVFEKLAAEDAEFMDDEDEVEKIPTFGDSKSSYEEVVGPFYAYWQAYCTKKTYTWLCPYNVKEIRDRRVLREVEKEMKKLVQKARKERNEEVRNLVSFVRKRDRRVQAYRKMLEERAELNRKKQEQNRLEQIRKRQRELEEMRENQKQSAQHHNDDYEAQLKLLEQNYGGSSADEETESESADDEEAEAEDDKENENAEVISDEDELYVDDLYCVACNKMFKNERAYANHESSKKHREAFERMKLEMQAEEEAFQGNNEEGEGSEVEWVDSEAKEFSDYPDEKDGSTETHQLANEVDASTDEEPLTGRKGKKSKKARKNAKLNKSQQPVADDEHETIATDLLAHAKIGDSDEEDWNSGGKKSARKNKNKKQNKKVASEVETPNTAKDETKVIQKAEPEPEPNVEIKPNITTAASEEDDDDSDELDKNSSPPKAKAKPKAKQSSAASTSATSTAHVCVTCKANFPSKNKLFAHLKITNHGVYIPKADNDAKAAAAEGKNTKKGKGKKK